MRHPTCSARWLALAASLSSACALAPNVPAGPITGSVRFGGSFVFAHAPARVVASDGSGEVHFRGNSAMYGGSFLPLLPRLGARLRASEMFDFGVDLTPIELGLQLRGGPLHASLALPWGIEFELRTTGTALMRDELLRGQRIVSVRTELYPPLPFGRGASGLPNAFGVFTLGLSGGRRLLPVTGIPLEHQDSGEELLASSLKIIRDESRLESSVGLHWLVDGGAFTLVAQPWLALSQGAPRESNCTGCYLRDARSVDGDWGLSIALSAMLVGGEP